MDNGWSCRARSELVSILRVAENCYPGDLSEGAQANHGQEILRYIRNRAFRKRFGKSPLQYRMEGRAARPTYRPSQPK